MELKLLLENKIAFVTGSSRGIGWGIAETFVEHGAEVILHGRTKSKHLETKFSELNSKRGGACSLVLVGDVSSPETISGWYQQIFKTFKRLDILVNNAGILDDNLLGMIPQASVDKTLNVNTLGSFYNLERAARLMTRAKSGSIINMTSIIGTNGNAGQVVYGMSKSAVIGMTKSAAKELAEKNIRVNAIAPGFIDTSMTRDLPEDKFDERMQSIKMGRIGTPQDIAGAAVFFASDLSAYVTGQVIGVDGGMLI